ncbi:MAG: SpoIIE family protein phosphatase [Terricaulis silvestris]
MHRRHVDDDLAAVGAAAAWADALIAQAGLPDDARHDFHVCLEEALANLILHGKPREGGKDIELDLELGDGAVALSISDHCAPFDLTDESVLIGGRLDEERIGGRGIRLIRAMAGDLNYLADAERNTLRMRFPNLRSDPDIMTLRAIPAFASANDEVLAELVHAGRKQDFPAGARLVEQNMPSEFALVLLAGDVEIINESAHGEARLAQIAAPALVGEIGALAQLERTASIRAASPVRALLLDRDALIEASRHAPALLSSVIGQLGKQIRGVNAALGLYAAGLSALGRDDFNPAVLEDLNNPTPEVANFAAAFKDLARRVTTERRSRAEMASAALIQRAMLPNFDASVLGARADAFADMKPAREVGGDLFDLFMMGEDRLGMVVGDVCGKGVPASLFMCATVTALRLAARQEDDLVALIEQTNAALCAQNATSMFTTLFYAVLDLETRRLEYVNCGHNPPYLLRGGGCDPLSGSGVPLGFYPDRTWTKQVLELRPGDGVFIFTDGVTEAASPAGEEYGEARLAAQLSAAWGGGAMAIVQAVMADVEAFSGGAEPFDDVTCVAAILR